MWGDLNVQEVLSGTDLKQTLMGQECMIPGTIKIAEGVKWYNKNTLEESKKVEKMNKSKMDNRVEKIFKL